MKIMNKRKSPVRHRVKTHIRERRPVRTYARGRGQIKPIGMEKRKIMVLPKKAIKEFSVEELPLLLIHIVGTSNYTTAEFNSRQKAKNFRKFLERKYDVGVGEVRYGPIEPDGKGYYFNFSMEKRQLNSLVKKLKERNPKARIGETGSDDEGYNWKYFVRKK